MEEPKERFVGIGLAKKTMEVRILEQGKKIISWQEKTNPESRIKFMKHLYCK